jgi:predicted GNAT family acetyltransferase
MTAMGWFITADVGEFLAEAGEFLRAEPARHSVVLTVTENLLRNTAAASGSGPGEPLFGWWQPDPATAVAAVFMYTPEFPVLLSSHMSGPAAAELARYLAAAGGQFPGINAGQEAADAFAAVWRDRTGDAVTAYRRMRLLRLDELIRPAPGPEGAARSATERDRDLLAGWFDAFAREVGDPPRHDTRAVVDERLGYGGITLWEAGGVPVSLAGLTRVVAGMVRVAPVYTPPELRGRGYAGAATAAVSQAALEVGVREVVLYTDLANATSKALYQRLGYRPVEDRVVLSFQRARGGLRFTRERTPGLRPAGRR